MRSNSTIFDGLSRAPLPSFQLLKACWYRCFEDHSWHAPKKRAELIDLPLQVAGFSKCESVVETANGTHESEDALGVKICWKNCDCLNILCSLYLLEFIYKEGVRCMSVALKNAQITLFSNRSTKDVA